MSSSNLDEIFSGGGAKSAFSKDSPIGTMVSGPILEVTTSQITDYVTSKPKTWDDGRPQMQVVVKIQTDHRDDADDDGVRGVYIKTWGPWKDALMEAVKATGKAKVSEALVPGNIFSARFAETRPSKQGSDSKIYQYRIEVRAVELDDPWAAPPAPAAPAPAPAPVQAAPAPAAPAPAAAGGDPAAQAAKARQMIALGLTDDVIAGATGLPLDIVAAVRNAA